MVFFLVGAHELYANAWNLHIFNPIAATLAGRAIIVIATLTTWIARSVSTVIPQKLLTKVPMVIAILLLHILNISGQKALKNMYKPSSNWYAEQSYELGLALRRNSQPNDLVVTLAHALGDPVAIYYSHRRGWVFTLGEGFDYPEQNSDTALPKDDNISIQMIESLRKQGASWLGIVGVHQNKINKKHPLLLGYLKKNCALKEVSPDWTVYRFLPPK